ncbi:MAG: hypothetical protein OEY56_07450 [Cyclobacteriaceae bacterium]|nr:hypothetical protein [Cyclobacteriaceae bacterium]
MKTYLKYNLMALLFLFALNGQARQMTEATKVINKTYKVTAATGLSIRNSYGNVHVNTWEKAEFSIKVDVIARAGSEEKAHRILDQITIDINESGAEIAFLTQLDKVATRSNEEMEINYTVFMPIENPLRIKNSFGDMYVDNRRGESNLEIAYGSLKAGELTNSNQLKVSFGSADILRIEKGEAIFKYSKISIESAGTLKLGQHFSEVELEEVGTLDLESRFGSVWLGKSGRIDADVEHSKFEIGELNQSLQMDAAFVSNFKIGLLRKEFELVDITGKYGSYNLNLESGVRSLFEGTFRFADLRDSEGLIDFNYKIRDMNLNEYKGRIGAGNTSKLIRISSSYGDCKIRQE